jgi:hypothetical protein
MCARTVSDTRVDHDPVAGCDVGDPSPDRVDHPSAVGPEYVRRRGRTGEPAHDEEV